MKILYHVVGKTNPSDQQAPKKFYAAVKIRETIKLDDILDEIVNACSLTRGDVYSAIENLVDSLHKHILSGNKVDFGRLGTFYPSISSEGTNDPSAVTSREIKKLRINFAPSHDLKNKLKNAEFEKYTEPDD
jgi:predicted histone-like DNA-binding protein